MPRKDKKFHFIYKTINLLSGKYYIGMHSTDNLDDGYMGSGKRLRYSINKHGVENHVREILEFVDSREELKKREEEIVNLNEIAKEECMNLKVGGEGGFTLDTQKKGINAWLYKYSGGTEHLSWVTQGGKEKFKKYGIPENFRYDSTGKKHSEETKKKMSESSKGMGVGETNSQYGTCWITKDGINKKIKKEELVSFVQKGWERGRKYYNDLSKNGKK